MSQTNDQFYSDLAVNRIPLADLFTREDLFYEIPADWHVIITDIKNSTEAVLGGQHETVNLVATGSIVTVLNIAYKAAITVPFFFGGDGATFIVPSSILNAVMSGLHLYQSNTLTNFNLDLRVGTMPVKEIYAKGEELLISKFSSSRVFAIPIVLGNGLNYAEKVIKGEDYLLADLEATNEELDLSGMECRWDKIAPPENSHEVVTLLAVAGKGVRQAYVFRKVIKLLDEIYGKPEIRQPISVPKLKLKTSFNRLQTEMKARIGKIKSFELIRNWFTSFFIYVYFKTKKGKKYLNSLVEMSDTLVIDGKVNTVITGTEAQRLRLQNALNDLETAGEILYGLYVSRESVMSCYVRNLEDGHIHFVDGADGGYTKAAGFMKLKIKAAQ